MKKNIIIAAIILISAAAHAAIQPIELTIDEAIKRGLDYAPDVKRAQSAIKQAHDQLNQARGSLFPTINGVATGQNKENAATFSGGNIPSFFSANGNFFQAGLQLTQPLYSGGALTGGLSYYKNLEDQARQNYFNAKQAASYNIINAYYSLAQAQQQLDAAQSNRDILKAYLDITSYYERIGRARQMDKMQAQVNYSLALIDVTNNQNLLNTSESNLDKLLGDDNGKVYKPVFQVSISDIGGLTLDQAYDAAAQNNPTIRADQLKVEQVGYQEKIDLSQDMPNLSLAGQMGYQSFDVPTLFQPSSQYYSIGLNLSVPIFSGLSSFSKRASYGEQLYQAKRTLDLDEDTLRAAVQNSMLTIRSTEGQLEVSQKSVKEARTALDIANKSYKQGTASNIDVLNLQMTRYNAEKLFITTQFNYLNALLGLRQQMGIDLEKAYAHK